MPRRRRRRRGHVFGAPAFWLTVPLVTAVGLLGQVFGNDTALCDTLLRKADCGAFRPLWSNKVEEEALRALGDIHPDIDPSRFHSRFRSMNEAFEDARVLGWERSGRARRHRGTP